MATAVSADIERHVSSLIVVLEFYPQMAIQMIHEWPPNIVLKMIQNDPNNKFVKSLNKAEKKLIQTLDIDGYNQLDMSLLYKLIRRFNLVAEPSKKWGNRPLATNIDQGDDMERMRYNRNDLVHRPKGGLSEEEREKFFQESIEIACRVDSFIGQSTSSFESRIRSVKIYRITQEQYRQTLETCVELQQQLRDISGINHVDLYYGDDIAVRLGHQDLSATDSTRCSLYIRDSNMNVPAIIEKLEQVKIRLNEGSFNQIKLLEAETGSLVLHVDINNLCFITKDSLHKAIAEFLHRVFTSISGNLDQNVVEVVLTECDSYIISDNEEENDEYLNDQEPSVLKLDVMVRNTALQSKTDLYRDVHGFISKVLNVTDKDVESTNGSPLGVIMTSQHVDDMASPTTDEKPQNKERPDTKMTDISDKFCSICDVTFTSTIHAKDHYSGKGHKRALTLKETMADDLFCSLCQITCSGPENMKLHKNGKSHRKREEESRSHVSINEEYVSRVKGEGMASPTTDEKPQNKERPDIKMTDISDKFCSICDVTFTSTIHAKDHYSGKGHKRALTLKETMGDDSFKCNTCQVKCSSAENLEEHFQGKSHKKKQQRLSEGGNYEGEKEAGETSVYYDVQSHFEEDITSKNNEDCNDGSSSEEDNTNKGLNEVFVKNLLKSAGDVKYTKTFDYKKNLNITEEKNMDKMHSLNDELMSLETSVKGKFETTLTKKKNIDIIPDTLLLSSSTQKSGGNKETLHVEEKTASLLISDRKSNLTITAGKDISKKPESEKDLTKTKVATERDASLVSKKTPITPTVKLPKKQQHFHCASCNQLMNTEKAYQDHLQGKKHMSKLLAPERVHAETVSIEVDCSELKIKTKPRKYQEELFRKAMQGEAICFLPTGTGKTLIGCMVISKMLEQNPTRQVIFLVDRGLLVLQQYQYIKRELGDIMFTRFGCQDLSSLEERKLLIAGLCSGSQSSSGVPLWKHDVIVVTAAYYENLLEKNLLRWKDTSLVVFDEAHHCVKSHPYNRLLYFQHREFPVDERPKLLGLTASPAGKATVEQTVSMLNELMSNVGDAKIEIVEENQDELDIYRSNAKIEIQTVSLNTKEKKLKQELQVYILLCYRKMTELTNLLQHSDPEELMVSNKNDAEIRRFAEEKLDGTLLNYIQMTVDMSGPRSGYTDDQKELAHNLKKHTQYMCVTLNILLQFGMIAAIDELHELMNRDDKTNFEFARKADLPCDTIQRYCDERLEGATSKYEGKLSQLIDLLTSKETLLLLGMEKSMVLILVKERGSAFEIEEIIRSQVLLRTAERGVSALVGHGTTSGTEPGMKVSHQKGVLDNIREHKYNIVVATSVAEEGIDIPECELVITLNPPSNVTALVQMRGRARKSESKFIVVCNSTKEKEDLEDLLKRERNMMDAVKILASQ